MSRQHAQDRPDHHPEKTMDSSTQTSEQRDTAGDAEAETPAAPRPDRPPLRVGTVVWGLVVAAVGLGILAVSSGVGLDVELAVIALVAAAGTALLVGSLVTGARQRRG